MTKTKLCKICGKEFKPYRNQSRYCSEECRREQERRRLRAYRQRPESKIKMREYQREYARRPEIKVKKAEYMRKYLKEHPQKTYQGRYISHPRFKRETQKEALQIWLADGFNEIKVVWGKPVLSDKPPERRRKVWLENKYGMFECANCSYVAHPGELPYTRGLGLCRVCPICGKWGMKSVKAVEV